MEVEETRPLRIKQWAAEDRPREKLLDKGTSSLSDAELVAIMIGTGTTRQSAVDIARQLLMTANNSLDEIARMSVKDLQKVKGIGKVKAIVIAAAMELGRRRKEAVITDKPRISGSADAYNLLRADMMDLPNEEFWVLLLNRANRVIRKKRISEGGLSGTVADPRIIFKLAIEELACSIIVAHNHPSGNLSASQSDIELTRRLKEAGKVMEVQLLDHLIIAGHKYFSFADEGLIG
jgi:DNA repair protein RadC